MTRRIVWSLLALVALITLGGVWFVQNFEQVPDTRWEGPQKEAQRNPYLAFERLFAKLGRPVLHVKSPAALDTLPAGGVLILDDNRRRNVDAARVQRLLDWVDRGAYLIVAAEDSYTDPLNQALGIKPCRFENKQCSSSKAADEEEAEEEEGDEDSEDTTAPPLPVDLADNIPSPIEVVLPGSPIHYRYPHHYPIDGLISTTPVPVWTAGTDPTPSHLLHYRWGRGQITVLGDLRFLRNWQIGNTDHAELIWALVRSYQAQGPIYLASRMEVPTLWQWLAESAWMALISGALLIALWLWHIVPRFGGLLTPARSERRDLLQHLAAIGRSVWREGGLAHWLSVVRHPLLQRLALRHPHLKQMETGRQHAALAEIAHYTTNEIHSALTPGQARSTKEFTRAMQILQSLDHRL